MLDKACIDRKYKQAENILSRCCGTHGVWADPERYKYQCWTRDFAIAIAPLLSELKMVAMGNVHLGCLSHRISSYDGKVPILFLDDEKEWLRHKITQSIGRGKIGFMLERYLQGELENLTPGTRDSEICYLLASYQDVAWLDPFPIFKRTKARKYIREKLMKNGLHVGCDWRDTMEKELGDKSLLSNNSILYRALVLRGEYEDCGDIEFAALLKERIIRTFWNGKTFIDYPGSDRFDPFGASLAVLFDVASPEHYGGMIDSFRSVDTPCGVTIKCRHNAYKPEEHEVIERTDGEVVWPFIVGYSILALLKMDEVDFAKEQFEKYASHSGFWEWIDPGTGKGYGAPEQLWSAALFMRVVHAFRNAHLL